MVRKQLYVTQRQDKELRKISKETGLPFADIVRRILDYYLENGKAKDISLMKVTK